MPSLIASCSPKLPGGIPTYRAVAADFATEIIQPQYQLSDKNISVCQKKSQKILFTHKLLLYGKFPLNGNNKIADNFVADIHPALIFKVKLTIMAG
ncbi:hypothetical protein [Shewanella sedimentimangrovi]|uniref:Lipoprotein n=1 Tax=Shewanella sedimentimangrovi TaxID=2814293 RepID=A0ABX7R148_9GAMM|nr:hypothetical protein [Shewanella sedimentimangrovi]QSX36810.1 hypothetical protein JYB85_16265 [Shewanella sedimentimangrovi]